MKKAKVIVSLVVSIAIVTAFSATSLAADPTPQVTTATIEIQEGDLVLAKAPGFDFGTQTAPAVTKAYNAVSITDNVTVEDARGGTEGWTLTAKLSKFNDGSVDSLPSSAIALSQIAPTPGTGSGGSGPVVRSGINLLSGDAGAVPIAAATGANGNGQWEINWGLTDVNLTLHPNGLTTGNHSATLTWSLVTGP